MHRLSLNTYSLGSLCLVLLLLLVVGSAVAQQERTLNVGNLLYITNEGLTEDDAVWPREWGHNRSIYVTSSSSGQNEGNNQLDMLHAHGLIIGVKRTWTDPLGVQHNVQVAQASHNKFTDIEQVVVPVSGAFKRVYRNPFPRKVIDGADRTDILAQGDPVDSSIPSDVMIYVHCETWPGFGMGIDVERWSYAFANAEHGDYIINEYVFTNTSGEDRNDVYFALSAETNAHTFYEDADLWGNYYGVTYHNYVTGDPTADSLRMYYSWSANDKSIPADTKARTDPLWGNFEEPQYFGYLLLHADKSADDESDDPNLPHKAGWSQRDLSPNLNEETHEGMYAFISDPWASVGSNLQGYSMFVDADGNEVNQGFYRILDPTKDVRDFDMLSEQEKSGLFSFGPYQMKPGDDVRIVMAFVGGSIPLRLAIDAGRAYKNGYSQQFEIVPLPYDVYDLQGNLIASKGSTLTKDQKDAIIDMSKDLLFRNAGKVLRTWNSSNVHKGQGSFATPFAPAAPSLEVFSENDQVRLKWGTEAEQDSRAGTIAGYRIYRDYKRSVQITSDSEPTDTTFFLLKELPVGTHEYVDTEVSRGEDYYYYVTAVTVDGIESSPFLNRTGVSATREDEAATPTRSPSATWQASAEEGGVVVVPNPYHASAAEKYAGRRLNFLNLPAYANIHIYTMTGDLVQTLEHDASTGDEDWERQDTFSTMEIVSGVYIYVVEELDGPRGNATGKKSIGKFVVIK